MHRRGRLCLQDFPFPALIDAHGPEEGPAYHPLALAHFVEAGIHQQVAADGGSNLRMGPGTLYGSLQRMAADGLVEEREEEREEDDERRRYYQLTAGGQRALRGELERLRQALAAARRKRVPLGTAKPLSNSSAVIALPPARWTFSPRKSEENFARMADLFGDAMPVQLSVAPPMGWTLGYFL